VDAVQPRYLLLRAGRSDNFGGHSPDSSGHLRSRFRV
jgi:hypothetical protein